MYAFLADVRSALSDLDRGVSLAKEIAHLAEHAIVQIEPVLVLDSLDRVPILHSLEPTLEFREPVAHRNAK
jgi:hypothetical protein